MIKLSPKFKDFLLCETKRDYLEGTTAAGKTTVGITKFMLMVAKSDKKYHLLCGLDLGTVEKNVINSECGLLAQFGVLANYYSNGKGRIGLPHIVYDTPTGEKIIYVSGYDNRIVGKKFWERNMVVCILTRSILQTWSSCERSRIDANI